MIYMLGLLSLIVIIGIIALLVVCFEAALVIIKYGLIAGATMGIAYLVVKIGQKTYHKIK